MSMKMKAVLLAALLNVTIQAVSIQVTLTDNAKNRNATRMLTEAIEKSRLDTAPFFRQ